jgi:DNA mismatch endonuclease (patch repair protein)
MADKISPERRSLNMAAIKSRNTKPEIAFRKRLHALGFRFRLHRKDLPGRPDIVLTRYKTAIFVHGCFWHQHEGCKLASKPSSRQEYWKVKFDRNAERDKNSSASLTELGWRVVVVWECEVRRSADEVAQRLKRFLTDALETNAGRG